MTSRAILASTNPVWHHILFGTGHIAMDLAKPIEWPDVDDTAVRTVFQVLVSLGNEEIVTNMKDIESTKVFVDYLLETRARG